ncbi:hypothetical protein BJ166DRAFT_29299 [Pestalotiopsis sp. NC0098]|nr:hypothetical protein BJ166DRAFT_29299 [Pestalotiopsis sp. NC0098]
MQKSNSFLHRRDRLLKQLRLLLVGSMGLFSVHAIIVGILPAYPSPRHKLKQPVQKKGRCIARFSSSDPDKSRAKYSMTRSTTGESVRSAHDRPQLARASWVDKSCFGDHLCRLGTLPSHGPESRSSWAARKLVAGMGPYHRAFPGRGIVLILGRAAETIRVEAVAS